MGNDCYSKGRSEINKKCNACRDDSMSDDDVKQAMTFGKDVSALRGARWR